MIDAKIKDGDVLLDAAGRTEIIENREAEFQRALVCLTVKKGSFIYDRELGVRECPDSGGKRELVMSEALADMSRADVRLIDESRVEITVDGESRIEEVRNFGEV